MVDDSTPLLMDNTEDQKLVSPDIFDLRTQYSAQTDVLCALQYKIYNRNLGNETNICS